MTTAVPGRREILVVDNYDSFVWTIAGYLEQLGAGATVVRNDETVPDLAVYDGVLVSPGPGTPAESGISPEVVQLCAGGRVPLLGVCLGLQVLGEVFGATVSHAPELRHGKTSLIEHDGSGVFTGLPSPFTATRYHSLAVERDTIPEELTVTAATTDGVVMGLAHYTLPLHGVQFHPEAVLTEHGHRLLANWLAITGDRTAPARSHGMAPLVRS